MEFPKGSAMNEVQEDEKLPQPAGTYTHIFTSLHRHPPTAPTPALTPVAPQGSSPVLH